MSNKIKRISNGVKIAFFEIQGWEKKFLRKKLEEHHLEFYNETDRIRECKEN